MNGKKSINMGIGKIFDYAFYRMTKAYKKWDGYRGTTAIFGVSLIQAMFIIDIALVVSLESFSKSERLSFSPYDKIFIVILMGILVLLNFKKYRYKYYSLDEKWKNETKSQKITYGILVILLILIPVIFPIILVNLKDYSL